jgi:hypothetical protein
MSGGTPARLRKSTEHGTGFEAVGERIGDAEFHALAQGSTFEIRHRQNHELVKQWHREGHVAMRRAVDHPFPDQLRADRPEAGDLYAQGVRDVACAMSARSMLGHCTQKILFARREPIKSDTEKILIQSRDDCCGRSLDQLQRDWTGFAEIPSLVSPFLKEIWISLREPKYFLQCIRLELYPCGVRWLSKSFRGIVRRERANIRETEEPLGVGFRFTGQPREDRKLGSQQHQWELPLLDLVHRHDQRTKFLVAEVLDFINEQGHGAFLSAAASATATKRLGKSISRSPLSAAPFSGSMSRPILTSATVNLSAPTKPRSTANPRFALSPAPAARSRS